jgi:hypothetical protein
MIQALRSAVFWPREVQLGAQDLQLFFRRAGDRAEVRRDDRLAAALRQHLIDRHPRRDGDHADLAVLVVVHGARRDHAVRAGVRRQA